MKELRQQEMDKEYEQEDYGRMMKRRKRDRRKFYNHFYFCDEIIDNF